MREPLFRGWWQGSSGTAALLALIAALISATGCLHRVDHLLFDLGQALQQRPAPDDLVIVAIDAESLAKLGRWPWPREQHARLLRTVCAARPAVVAVAIAFSERSERRSSDQDMAEAVATCRRVVLPVVIELTGSAEHWREVLPIPELGAVAAGIGRISVRLDEDGIARGVDLQEDPGGVAWPLFAAETLRIAGRADGPASTATPPKAAVAPVATQPWRPEQARRIAFLGPPGTVKRVSFADVVDGKIKPETFARKIVLLGATAAGLGDALPTPVSGRHQAMPGVEIQANIVAALRDGRLITTLADAPSALITAMLATVPLLWLPRLMPLPGLLASTAWLLALALGCALLPQFWQIWLPPSGSLVAGAFAFPIWSWRRLEVAGRHLDQELRQLQRALPDEKGGQASPERLRKLRFEQRIAAVQQAQQSLQRLQEQRKEALTFISHDLRAPLSNVISQLEATDAPAVRQALPPLRRALRMAQAFVWLARAESLEQARMQDIELISLIEQAADELYAPAKARGIALRQLLPDDPVWISGDFESLQRSLCNLLENALHYAATNTVISVGLDRHGESSVRLWVENDGPALPAADRQRLFHRFERGDQASASPCGTGLGLYYVRTVAQAHGGEAGVDCADGRIRFWVRLPVAKA